MPKGKTITAWTTVPKGSPIDRDYPNHTIVWPYRVDAEDNARDGGHKLVKLTLKIVKAKRVRVA